MIIRMKPKNYIIYEKISHNGLEYGKMIKRLSKKNFFKKFLKSIDK